MENLHIRLRDEIERLKLSMAEVARKIGEENSQGIRDICSGRKRMSAEVLARISSVGVDVLFVLTGERQTAVPEAPEPALALATEEELLLDAYREMDGPARKKLLKAVLQGGTDQAGGKIINHDGSTIGNQIHGDVTITSQSIGAVAPKTTKKKN